MPIRAATSDSTYRAHGRNFDLTHSPVGITTVGNIADTFPLSANIEVRVTEGKNLDGKVWSSLGEDIKKRFAEAVYRAVESNARHATRDTPSADKAMGSDGLSSILRAHGWRGFTSTDLLLHLLAIAKLPIPDALDVRIPSKFMVDVAIKRVRVSRITQNGKAVS